MLRPYYRLFLVAALIVVPGVSEICRAGQQLVSDYRDYRIRLRNWRPLGSAAYGVLVPVRINSGPTLHLVLDSGAAGITLGSKTARQSQLNRVSDAGISGFGREGKVAASMARADSVYIGDLIYADCPILVLPGIVARDADGVIGTKFFEAFRIQLDASARELYLAAFAEGAGTVPEAGPHAPGHLLFVPVKVNGSAAGLFLVDTGSAVTALSNAIPWASPLEGVEMDLIDILGQLRGAKRVGPVSLEISGRKVLEPQPVTLNLEVVSQRNGIKVSGILGYSVLSQGRVLFDYREGRVELSSR